MKKRKADADSNRSGYVNVLLTAISALCLLLSAICRFVLPGVRFSALLFLGCAVACIAFCLLNYWAARSNIGRCCRIASICVLAAGSGLFLIAEGMILWA